MYEFSEGNLIDDVTMLAVRAGRLTKASTSAAGVRGAGKPLSPVTQD
jgi:hypothetical protein